MLSHGMGPCGAAHDAHDSQHHAATVHSTVPEILDGTLHFPGSRPPGGGKAGCWPRSPLLPLGFALVFCVSFEFFCLNIQNPVMSAAWPGRRAVMGGAQWCTGTERDQADLKSTSNLQHFDVRHYQAGPNISLRLTQASPRGGGPTAG